MKTNQAFLFALLLSSLTGSGCELAGDIFKAGFWIGVLLVVLIVGLLIRFFRK